MHADVALLVVHFKNLCVEFIIEVHLITFDLIFVCESWLNP